MSRETMTTLNNDILIGFQEVYGKAWHYDDAYQGAESNHYTGAIPVEDVYRRLFDWEPMDGEITITAIGESGVIQITDGKRKAILRSDTAAVLGIFTKSYQVHPYKEWLVENVETILSTKLAIGRAGLLQNGGVAFVQVEMKETMTHSGIDFRPFLTASTSMNGKYATSYVTGAQLAVCDNTLDAAIHSAAASYKLKHTRYSLNKILEAREALEIAEVVGDNFTKQLDVLLDEAVTDARFEAFADAFTGFDPNADEGRAKTLATNKRNDLSDLWYNDNRVTPWKNTAFGVVQAVNTFGHHVANVRGATRLERNAERILSGAVHAMDQGTLDLLATV